MTARSAIVSPVAVSDDRLPASPVSTIAPSPAFSTSGLFAPEIPTKLMSPSLVATVTGAARVVWPVTRVDPPVVDRLPPSVVAPVYCWLPVVSTVDEVVIDCAVTASDASRVAPTCPTDTAPVPALSVSAEAPVTGPRVMLRFWVWKVCVAPVSIVVPVTPIVPVPVVETFPLRDASFPNETDPDVVDTLPVTVALLLNVTSPAAVVARLPLAVVTPV
ncbi:MAG: hypothetical protein GIKADHBN_03242 [Phycisphaerales bacterium]|nr:hypothetical protein [Phycisphaerales bacterium]